MYADHTETEHPKIFHYRRVRLLDNHRRTPFLDESGNRSASRATQARPKQRDTENVPFTYGGPTAGAAGTSRSSRPTSTPR